MTGEAMQTTAWLTGAGLGFTFAIFRTGGGFGGFGFFTAFTGGGSGFFSAIFWTGGGGGSGSGGAMGAGGAISSSMTCTSPAIITTSRSVYPLSLETVMKRAVTMNAAMIMGGRELR